MESIHDGIWTWCGTHPNWRTQSELVRSYAIETGGGLAIVDPLLSEDVALDDLVVRAGGRPCAVFVTIHYHLRDSEQVARALDAPVVGSHLLAKKLATDTLFVNAAAVDELPLGARAIPIGTGRRSERPIYFPDVRALAVGDSIVSVPDGLRVWSHDGDNHAELFQRIADLDVDIVLATHGEPVISAGHDAIVEALTSQPTDYRVEQMHASVRT